MRAARAIIVISTINFLLGSPAVAAEPRSTKVGDAKAQSNPGLRHFQNIDVQGAHARVKDLKFAHLTTRDGLALDNVVSILQDHRGFMWFGTGDGLNRYDGNALVVYKNDPHDPGSLSANFIRDLVEDEHGNLWVDVYPGVNKFDPTTERCTRYLHDPNNPNSLSGESVWSIARDSRGYLWFATADSGLDRFDPATETFTHYRNDRDGHFVGWITRVIEDRHREIWFVGERGLFHLNVQTGQMTRPPAMIKGLSADDLYEDKAGDFWMLAYSPIIGLVKYDRHAERFSEYPFGAGAARLDSSKLLDDGGDGFWVASSLGLYHFDRRTERFTQLFQHDDTNPNSLSDNSVGAIYRDRGGLLWVGTRNGGLNILDFQQEQFGHFTHRPADPDSLSSGKATAIYEEPNGILWVGLFPRALDRFDRKNGKITHYVHSRGNKNSLSEGNELNSIFKDARGYLWVGGLGAGLDRFDERTGQFKHYAHKASDPNSLMTDDVITIYGDANGQLWVGQFGGVSRFDPATERFTNYRPGQNESALAYSVSAIQRDRSSTLWLGTWGGVLSRFDEKTNTFVNYTPDLRDPHRLQGGSIGAIHEDRAGTLWLASGQGLYRYNRQNQDFTRYTESQGLPNVDLMGILEDDSGRLWISTKKGISRFDPKTGTFRNYDVSDGLQSNEFSRSCYQQGQNGEMLFCGSNGITTFIPENIRDNPFVPPVAITSFKIFNKPVPISSQSVLTKAISYADGVTLSYRDNIFSFEFSALSYANSQKNRYRYKLENFEPDWNEVDSKQRLATYTNLDPGKYVFRVQGSNSDGVWNEEGVSLPIVITPPWWRTNWFRTTCAAVLLALLWAAYQLRVRQLRREFNTAIEARVSERTRIARDLHDTLLQSLQALLFQYQAARNLFAAGSERGMQVLDATLDRTEQAIAESRDTIRDIRSDNVAQNNLPELLTMAGTELAESQADHPLPAFGVTVEGERRTLRPIIREETYRIALELLRNAFHHANARRIETEIRYDHDMLRLRIRDDGKGMDPKVLEGDVSGHWGLRGVRERAERIGAKLDVWSEAGAGTEFELTVPARIAYDGSGDSFPFRLLRKVKGYAYRN
jgi:ligand-binding sensor domain-containing protein/signal transduction histidine kinase